MLGPIKKITLVVFLAASCNLVWQFYRIERASIERQKAYEQDGIIACKLGPSSDETARILIELFLLVALVGSRLKGVKNTLVTVVGLSGAAILYIFWWQYVFRLVALAAVDVKYIRHFAYLYNGNILDIAIAGSILLLVLLNVWDAARSLFRPTNQ